MWPRNIELMLGCWLIVSPFVFRHPPDRPELWWIDLGFGSAVVVLALLSYAQSLKRLHLVTLGLAAALAATGWLGARSEELAAFQDRIIVGLLLAMHAVLPSHANVPPGYRRRIEPDRAPAAARDLRARR